MVVYNPGIATKEYFVVEMAAESNRISVDAWDTAAN
jgi:hypothetical protein